MRALLIAPSFENPRYPLYLPSENLGIAYVASSLRHRGFAVDLIDANMLEASADTLLSYLPSHDYGIVGIAVPFQTVVDEALLVASLVKGQWPDCHVTVGGHFPTFRDVAILESSPDVDSVVRGDGEETFSELALAVFEKRSLHFIAGLTFRDKSGRIITNLPRTPPDDLDSLPYPARDTLRDIQRAGHPWPTQISSSRGCYASCAFCDIRQFYGRTWRARAPVKLVDEIQYLQTEYGSKRFRFTDDEFIGPRPGKGLHGPTRAREIALEILRRGLTVELMIDARPEAVDRSLFTLLREAGTIDCLVGVESGVDRILKLYSKGATVRHNIDAVRILRDLGISLNLGFIMFDPRMTMAELRANYHFLIEQDIATVDSLRSWLWPLYGTPVVEQLRAAGLVTNETLGDVFYRFADPTVGEVFDVVSRCTKITFPFDYALFTARKRKTISVRSVDDLSAELLSLWKQIFEEALRQPLSFDYDSVRRATATLLAAIAKLNGAQSLSVTQ
jgi:radical SAM superfamily enzyme YgiQ (UPF0313 family)